MWFLLLFFYEGGANEAEVFSCLKGFKIVKFLLILYYPGAGFVFSSKNSALLDAEINDEW